jgi:hypothetical protein
MVGSIVRVGVGLVSCSAVGKISGVGELSAGPISGVADGTAVLGTDVNVGGRNGVTVAGAQAEKKNNRLEVKKIRQSMSKL